MAETPQDPEMDGLLSRQDRNVHLRGLGEAALHRLRQLLRRCVRDGTRDGSDEHRDEFRPVAHVDAMQVPPQRDLVAPRGRQQVGVGVAADITEERLMVDRAPCGLVELRDVRQAHRQHARVQGKVSRVPRGEIRRVRQRHQEVRASNRRCRHLQPFSTHRIT
jgi:hypothetical protein